MSDPPDSRADPGQEGIAIVGMSGRFPGASSVDEFWSNIKNGVESITRFEEAELDLLPDYDSPDATAVYVPAKGVVENVDMFDAGYFGYYPREAAIMDPQHRVFLECCVEALETAGYDPTGYAGAIGVYAGCYMDTYLVCNICSNPSNLKHLIESTQIGSLETELGNDKDYLATHVSFKLDLRGPAVTLQTACSTSLVAVCHACHSLLSYQSDIVLAGGVTLTFPLKKGYFYKEGGMLSPDGHCRPFDADAQGTVFGNGAGVVVLKRESDALTDGDTIYAVIRGTAVNNDGARKMSYTAPAVDGQAEVISTALGVAGFDARSIDYVEAHGTATPLGDPIEIAALTKAFRAETADSGFCAIGSVKSNLGHLDVASGVVGLIKTTLAINEGVIPPTLHYEHANPNIDFERSPFYVNNRLRPWDTTGSARRAGVSSFGVGGTNAHVVLEEPPPAPPTQRDWTDVQIIPVSGKTPGARDRRAADLARHLGEDAGIDLSDAAFTLQVGRQHHAYRRVVVASSVANAVRVLKDDAPGGQSADDPAAEYPVVFMFPGQGSQYPGMVDGLYEASRVFRTHFDTCVEILRPLIGFDVRDGLGADPHDEAAQEELTQTAFAQPAIFCVEYAMAKLWMAAGIQPDALVGHSSGEIAAACIAGVLKLEDALELVARRGQYMQEMPTGSMLSVRAAPDALGEHLDDDVSVAARNGPSSTVLSGPTDRIRELAEVLEAAGTPSSVLHTSHAFHSAMMAPAAKRVAALAATLETGRATIPIVSTATAEWLVADDLADGSYWGRQLRQAVDFHGAIDTLGRSADYLFLEVGPGQALTSLTKQTLGPSAIRRVLPSLGQATTGDCHVTVLINTAAQLWLFGAELDWRHFHSPGRRRIPLPTYPFDRRRHWIEPASVATAGTESRPTDGGRAVTERMSLEELIESQLEIMAEQLAAYNGGDPPGEGD